MFVKRWILGLIVLSLVVVLMPACGNDDDDDGGTSTITSTDIVTPTATGTSVSGDPVKIGAIMSWSGAQGTSGVLANPCIEYMEHVVNTSGGILGGRKLEIVTCDNESSTAAARLIISRIVEEAGCRPKITPGFSTNVNRKKFSPITGTGCPNVR